MTPSSKSQFELKKLPGFPRTLLDFRQYDGGKTLAVIILILASIYFFTGFWGFLVDHNAWLHDWIYPPQPVVGVPGNPWWDPLGVFHKNSIAQAFTSVASYADIAFRLFIFLCAFCFAWGTFDPRNIEGYAMGLFNMFLGVAYVLSPMDVIPDALPVAGTLDDTVLGIGMVVLGLSGWYRTNLRDAKTKTVLELVDHGNTERALQLLLEDKGISVKVNH
jgi:uncharacterized membrane protein YkvA (DUF1232 family)